LTLVMAAPASRPALAVAMMKCFTIEFLMILSSSII
jgi:hypothetical protein